MKRFSLLALALMGALLAGLAPTPVRGQQKAATPPYKAPRNPRDGHADLSGIWMAQNTAYGSVEAHSASWGMRAGNSVIVDPADGKIPYKPEALKKRDENFAKRFTADPNTKCFTPGVPRIMYMPYPFEIFQTPTQVQILSEFGHTQRNVFLKGSHYAEGEFWVGDSRGKWDGDTLVIDVADFHPDTWLDMSGNFHSGQLRVVERLKRTSANTLQYEATLTDPEVYTRPWTIRMTLYRDLDQAQLYEYECHAYLEEYHAATSK